MLAIGNQQLFETAEAEYYRTNIFIAGMRLCHPDDGSMVSQNGVLPERNITALEEDDDDEMSKVLHLNIVFTGLRDRHVHPADVSEFGLPEAEALMQMPGAYPKLRTLTISLNHDISAAERLKGGYGYDEDTEVTHREEALGVSAEVATAELSLMTSILVALKEAKRRYRNTYVLLRFRHYDGSLPQNLVSNCEATRVDGHDRGIEELAWQVLGLPKALISL